MAQQNLSEDLLQLRKRARRRLIGAVALVIFSLCVLWTALDSQPPASMVNTQPVEVISSAPALAQVIASAPVVSQASAADQHNQIASAAMDGTTEQIQPAAQPLAQDASLAAEALRGRLINVQQPEASTTPVPPTPKPTAKPSVKPSPKPTTKPTPKPAADPQRILDGLDDPSAPAKPVVASDKKYLIQVGAYGDADKAAQAVAKMKSAGLPVVTDKVETREKGTLTRIRLGPTSSEAQAREWLNKLNALGLDGHIVTK